MLRTRLKRRVERLEATTEGGDRCLVCGNGPDNDKSYEVVFDDEMPDDLKETCPECGRELITTIYFEDDPNAPWNRREAARLW